MIGRLLKEPRDEDKAIAITVSPSKNSSTRACFPEQLVSDHELIPILNTYLPHILPGLVYGSTLIYMMIMYLILVISWSKIERFWIGKQSVERSQNCKNRQECQ